MIIVRIAMNIVWRLAMMNRTVSAIAWKTSVGKLQEDHVLQAPN